MSNGVDDPHHRTIPLYRGEYDFTPIPSPLVFHLLLPPSPPPPFLNEGGVSKVDECRSTVVGVKEG